MKKIFVLIIFLFSTGSQASLVTPFNLDFSNVKLCKIKEELKDKFKNGSEPRSGLGILLFGKEDSVDLFIHAFDSKGLLLQVFGNESSQSFESLEKAESALQVLVRDGLCKT